jgi:type I restriction enzyme, S subunit
MEMKAGYKQTEVGVVPEDWSVRDIGDIFGVTAGGDFDAGRSSSIQDEQHPYPIYSNAITGRGLYGYC